jgi:hypothetical protein
MGSPAVFTRNQEGSVMHLSNFKIATKIGGGFGIIVAVLIFMGITSLSQLKAVNASTEQIATNNLASIQTAAKMRDLISDIRFAEARHVMMAVEQEMDVQEARISADQKCLLIWRQPKPGCSIHRMRSKS